MRLSFLLWSIPDRCWDEIRYASDLPTGHAPPRTGGNGPIKWGGTRWRSMARRITWIMEYMIRAIRLAQRGELARSCIQRCRSRQGLFTATPGCRYCQLKLTGITTAAGQGRAGHGVLQFLDASEFFARINALFFWQVAFVTGFTWRGYHRASFV